MPWTCALSAVGGWNIVARGAQGLLSSAPLSLPGRDVLNLVMLGGILTDGAVMATTGEPSYMLPALGAGSGVAAVLGAHATASIGAWRPNPYPNPNPNPQCYQVGVEG